VAPDVSPGRFWVPHPLELTLKATGGGDPDVSPGFREFRIVLIILIVLGPLPGPCGTPRGDKPEGVRLFFDPLTNENE
jgi:hypothetical protein